MNAKYGIEERADGWAVVDTATRAPVVLFEREQVGLEMGEADDIADLLNGVLAHIFLVGIPIAFGAARWRKRLENQ